jgi:hypothetical protein
VPHRDRAQPRALSTAERQAILDVLHCERFADLAPAAVAVKKRIQPDMHLPGQAGSQHLRCQWEVVTLGVRDACASSAADCGQLPFLPGPCVLPADCVDVGAGGEQGAEQRDLCFGGRPSMQRSRGRFEEPDLRRAGRRSVPSAQLQQSKKPGVLRPQAHQLPGHLGWNYIFGIALTHSGHRMARRTFRPVVRDRRTLGVPRQLSERSELPSKG